jgi:hypothetical protein
MQKIILCKINSFIYGKKLGIIHKGEQMFGEEILLEIDSTLDQLILNAETIQDVDPKDLYETEIDAFQKTQESLLQHLMRMDQILVEKRNSLKIPDKRSAAYKIQEKIQKFEQLKTRYHKTITENRNKRSILSKRRSKKLLVAR